MKEAQTIDEVFSQEPSIDDFLEGSNIPQKVVTWEAFEPEKYAHSQENIFSYTSTKEADLEQKLAKEQKEKQKQKQQRTQTIRRAKIHAILTYVPVLSQPSQDTEQLFKNYFSSRHYQELESYLATVEKRDSFPVLATGRIELRNRDGERGPVAAMHPTAQGAYITIDKDYERHLAAMARGYAVPSRLTLEERADALREYTLDHENTHRYQRSQILAGTPEVKLERDVESTLWKFYTRQMNAYKGTPLEAKYSYLRGITEKRFKDAEQVYGKSTVKLT